MRHRKTVNHLGRTSSHRKAMMSNMATSLIMHKRIRTTLAKAKALRTYVEPIITRSKEDTTHNRREVFSHLQDNNAVTELFRVVSQKVADRPGGYTRILKLENRLGDNAQMCFIELVDFNDHYVSDDAGKKGAKRTRRGSKKSTDQPSASAPVVAPPMPPTSKENVVADTVEPVAPEVAEAPDENPQSADTIPDAEASADEDQPQDEKNA